MFKYTSTSVGAKPTRDDLKRTLRRGIPGTAMPSFDTLPQEEIEALIEYVQYLSLRGQTELAVAGWLFDDHRRLPLDRQVVWREAVLPAWRSWIEAEGLVVMPPEPPAFDTPKRVALSIALGREFLAARSRLASIATASRAAATARGRANSTTIGTAGNSLPRPMAPPS